jgi:hypothetical protein
MIARTTLRPAPWLAALLAAALAAPGAAAGVHDLPPGYRSATPLNAQVDSIRYASRITDNNQMGITITNYGFIGNNFVSRSPSLEYPLGTGYEHMVRGGIWIGAEAIDENGAFIGVMTSAVDGAQGSSAANATEFTPAGLDIKVRSTLPNNKFFNVQAVSEQDYITSPQPPWRSPGEPSAVPCVPCARPREGPDRPGSSPRPGPGRPAWPAASAAPWPPDR